MVSLLLSALNLSLTSCPPATFVADASGFRESAPLHGESAAETCTFVADARGTCIESLPFGTTTIVATFSGPVVAFYTINPSTPTAPLTSSSGRPSQTARLNEASQHTTVPFYGVAALVLGSLFHLL
jgi:hypothetical protein